MLRACVPPLTFFSLAKTSLLAVVCSLAVYLPLTVTEHLAMALLAAILFKFEKRVLCIELTEVTFWCVVALPPDLAPRPFANGILPIVDTSALLPLSGRVLRRLLTRW